MEAVRDKSLARIKETYPAVNLPPPPAVGPRLGVDLHHVALLQRQLPGVARAEVVARDGHADHLGREHWWGGQTRRRDRGSESGRLQTHVRFRASHRNTTQTRAGEVTDILSLNWKEFNI